MNKTVQKSPEKRGGTLIAECPTNACAHRRAKQQDVHSHLAGSRMKSRIASLFLLFVLFGSAFAGVPLQFGESNCAMSGMMDMDCCQAMLVPQSQNRFTQEEEVLCALNCAQNGTTLPSSVASITLPPQDRKPALLSFTHSLVSVKLVGHVMQSNHSPGSPPTYLRNLTLLI
jgi:hypothetical protein